MPPFSHCTECLGDRLLFISTVKYLFCLKPRRKILTLKQGKGCFPDWSIPVACKPRRCIRPRRTRPCSRSIRRTSCLPECRGRSSIYGRCFRKFCNLENVNKTNLVPEKFRKGIIVFEKSAKQTIMFLKKFKITQKIHFSSHEFQTKHFSSRKRYFSSFKKLVLKMKKTVQFLENLQFSKSLENTF